MKIESGRFVRSAVSEADFVADGLPQVAFVGRSNVGKSSLLNRLLGRKALARISSTPGRTRAVNYFLVNSSLYFVDLPGFGYAKVDKRTRREWALLMEKYFTAAPDLALILHLVDAKVGATPLDQEAAEYFASLGLPATVVATKIDKVPRARQARQLEAVREQLALPADATVIPFSAVRGQGVKELWREIEACLQQPSMPMHVTRGAS